MEEELYTTMETVSVTPIAMGTEWSSTELLFMMWIWFSVVLVYLIVVGVALWRIFVKAGRAGWESLIPLYNYYVLLQIVGRPGWWFILLFVPFVNIVVSLLMMIDLAKSFGKSTTFGVVALFIFNVVGYIMLGFGDAKYVGPAGVASGGSGDNPTPTPTPAPPVTPTPVAEGEATTV